MWAQGSRYIGGVARISQKAFTWPPVVGYNGRAMKKDLHPTDYRPVVFQDTSDGSTFLTRSTATSDEVITLDGKEYPLVKVHISSSSHPFYTGKEKVLDLEGRVDRFKAKAAKAKELRNKRAEAAQKTTKNAGNQDDSTEASSKPTETVKIGDKTSSPSTDNK